MKSILNGLKITPLSPFSRTSRLGERPSVLSALFDGLLVSAGVHFEKDRQKYRQFIRYQRRKLARRLAFFLCISISYEVSARDLTMHLDYSRALCKLLKSIDNLSMRGTPHSHSILSIHRNMLIYRCNFFLLTVKTRRSSRQNFSLLISNGN
jgi:hypothetical protein